MAKRQRKKQGSNFLMQGAILAFAGVLTKIIGVVYRIPLTNILGDEGIGLYGYAFEVYALVLLLSTLSLPLAVSKLVSARLARRERKNAFRVFVASMIFAIVVGLIAALIVFFGAGAISEHMLAAPMSVYALKVLAPGIFIVAVMAVIRGYFQGIGSTVPTAVSQVIEQIVNAVVSIAGASILFGIGLKAAKDGDALMGPAYGAAGGTIGTVAGALAGCAFMILILYAYRKNIKRQIMSDTTRRTESYSRIFRILLMTIAPVVLSTAVYNVSQILDNMIFSKIMSAQGYSQQEYLAQLGIYSGKYNVLINVPLAMANGLAASVLPSITAAVTSGDREETFRRIHTTIRFAMLIAIPSFVGCVVLASPIMQLLFNDDRTTPAALLAIGAITIVFYCMSTVTNSILQGLGHMKTPVINAAVSLGIHLASLFMMLVFLKWNIYAVVVSNVIFAICMSYLNTSSISRVTGYKQEKDKTFFKPVTAAVIMGVAAYAIHLILDILIGGKIATILSVIAAVIVYAVSLLKLGGMTSSEIRTLPKGQVILRICRRLHLVKRQED